MHRLEPSYALQRLERHSRVRLHEKGGEVAFLAVSGLAYMSSTVGVVSLLLLMLPLSALA